MPKKPEPEPAMVEMALGRIVIQDGADRQYIFLCERKGDRAFPIVIGRYEAEEIQRVVHGLETERPLTHQLLCNTVKALGAELLRVDIVDLRHNTFFAQIVLAGGGGSASVVDSRPSDAIAVALRLRCPIRVAEAVLAKACVEESGPDEGPAPGPGHPEEQGDPEEGETEGE